VIQSTTTMDSIIENILKDRPDKKEAVEEFINTKLFVNKASSNRYFEFYTGKGNQDNFKEVEARLPINLESSSKGLLIFTLTPNNKYTVSYIKNTFKNQIHFEPPRPQDSRQIEYFKIRSTDYDLSFGFQDNETVCSVIVLEYRLTET